VQSIGFTLADKQAGAFRLNVLDIQFEFTVYRMAAVIYNES